MNLKEFANVDSLYRDLNTGQEVPWRDYMRRVIEKLGLENIKRHIPFGCGFLKAKYETDTNFNNIKLNSWMLYAGFQRNINRKTQTETIIPLRYGLSNLLVANGITCFSPSECVSILKEAARMLCND